MSLPRLLAWCLGGLLVLAAVALLLARGMGRPAYSTTEVAAIDSAWQRVLELASLPPPPPADVPVAADFADDLRAFERDGDAAHLTTFADWLAGDGPHRLHRGGGTALNAGPLCGPGPAWTLPLMEAGQHLATEADLQHLPGLLALARALRTEGHVLDLLVGSRITHACLDRLAAAPEDPTLARIRRAATDARPLADGWRRAIARDARALVEEVEAGGGTLSFHGGVGPTESLAGGVPREVLATALRQAAITVLGPGPPPTPPGAWDAVTTFLFGDPTLIERQLASLIAASPASLETTHDQLRQRWDDVLGAPPAEGPAEAPGTVPAPGGSPPSPAADGPPGG